MPWHRTGAKLLPVPMMTQFTDTYLHCQASVCWFSLQHIENTVIWPLSHWGGVTYKCISKIICFWCQGIIWTSVGLLSIGHLWINFQWNFKGNSNIFILEMHLKLASARWHPFRPSLNVLTAHDRASFARFPKHWSEQAFSLRSCDIVKQMFFSIISLVGVIHELKFNYFILCCIMHSFLPWWKIYD